MPRRTFQIRLFLLASVLGPVLTSCGKEKPRPSVSVTAPADLLSRADEPPMPAEALTSEEAYERARDAKVEWGRTNAGIIDRACTWLKSAGVKGLNCR